MANDECETCKGTGSVCGDCGLAEDECECRPEWDSELEMEILPDAGNCPDCGDDDE